MKDRKKINLFLIIMIALLIIPIYSYFKHTDNKTILENNYAKTIGNNTLSLMYETSVGSGEYVISNDNAWPSEKYTFNETRSKCENGSELTWDKDAKKVLLKSNISDRCYVYFDKEVNIANVCQGQNMASCIATNYELDSSIIYHNGTTRDATYGVIDAEDNNYRYAGSSESVNNFVCFGSNEENCPNDNLYRIIGVFNETNTETGKQEARVKLIKYDYALTNLLGTDGGYRGGYVANGYDVSYYRGATEVTTIPGYYFNSANGSSSTNDWVTSKLNTVNLNTNYTKNIGTNWADKIADTTWKIGGITYEQGVSSTNIAKNSHNYELGSNSIDKTHSAKIGLIYLSDYYYAADSAYWTYYGYNSTDATKDYRAVRDNNWMYMGLVEWSMTPRTDVLISQYIVGHPGSWSTDGVSTGGVAIRPCFYLENSIVLSGGSGSMTDPYRIA